MMVPRYWFVHRITAVLLLPGCCLVHGFRFLESSLGNLPTARGATAAVQRPPLLLLLPEPPAEHSSNGGSFFWSMPLLMWSLSSPRMVFNTTTTSSSTLSLFVQEMSLDPDDVYHCTSSPATATHTRQAVTSNRLQQQPQQQHRQQHTVSSAVPQPLFAFHNNGTEVNDRLPALQRRMDQWRAACYYVDTDQDVRRVQNILDHQPPPLPSGRTFSTTATGAATQQAKARIDLNEGEVYDEYEHLTTILTSRSTLMHTPDDICWALEACEGDVLQAAWHVTVAKHMVNAAAERDDVGRGDFGSAFATTTNKEIPIDEHSYHTLPLDRMFHRHVQTQSRKKARQRRSSTRRLATVYWVRRSSRWRRLCQPLSWSITRKWRRYRIGQSSRSRYQGTGRRLLLFHLKERLGWRSSSVKRNPRNGPEGRSGSSSSDQSIPRKEDDSQLQGGRRPRRRTTTTVLHRLVHCVRKYDAFGIRLFFLLALFRYTLFHHYNRSSATAILVGVAGCHGGGSTTGVATAGGHMVRAAVDSGTATHAGVTASGLLHGGITGLVASFFQ